MLNKIICMKKITISVFLVICYQLSFSQIGRDSSKRVTAIRPATANHARVIPPAQANLIRKDVMLLDQQFTLLTDSPICGIIHVDNSVLRFVTRTECGNVPVESC